MDGVELLKYINKICEHYIECEKCPLMNACSRSVYCLTKHPENAIEAVELWKEEHPPKTRQSELLKIFPDVKPLKQRVRDFVQTVKGNTGLRR